MGKRNLEKSHLSRNNNSGNSSIQHLASITKRTTRSSSIRVTRETKIKKYAETKRSKIAKNEGRTAQKVSVVEQDPKSSPKLPILLLESLEVESRVNKDTNSIIKDVIIPLVRLDLKSLQQSNRNNKVSNNIKVRDKINQDTNTNQKIKTPVVALDSGFLEKAKKQIRYKKVENRTAKQQEIGDNTKQLNANTKLLRKRKKVDYEEKRSLDLLESTDRALHNESGRIPIYKNILDEPVKRCQKDPFTFVPESDEDKDSDVSFRINTPKRRKVVVCKTNDRVQCKETKLKKKNCIKYDDKLNNILGKIQRKLNTKNIESPGKQLSLNNGQKIQYTSTPLNNPNTCSRAAKPKFDLSIRENNPDNSSKQNVIDKLSIEQPKITESPSKFPNNCSTINETNGFVDISRYTHLEDHIQNSFGFAEIETSKQASPGVSGRINIIQNVVLNKSTASNRNPSTPKQSVSKTWRFGTDLVTRNPHFISLKQNSLPHLSQDAVLDHTFDDEISKVNSTILSPANKKLPKQQSILDYIPTSKEHSNIKYSRQSLYDIDELSPIKSRQDKENSEEKKQRCIQQKGKRNVLGSLDSNILTNKFTSTPNRNTTEDISKKDALDFTFSSDLEENPQKGDKTEARPFRIETRNMKQYQSKRLSERLTKPVRDSELHKLIQNDSGFNKLVEEDGLEMGEVGLFEDFDEAIDTKQRKPRSKKPVEKKEVQLSKEARKWIKDFNAMCDEVDDFELEIV